MPLSLSKSLSYVAQEMKCLWSSVAGSVTQPLESSPEKPRQGPSDVELSRLADRVLYHAKTLLLFTYSDISSTVFPCTLFGICNALAATQFGIESRPSPTYILQRTPLVALWVWVNLLAFNCSNQRVPGAAEEDAINKPYRPIPQGRITPSQTKALMVCVYALGMLLSMALGGGLGPSILLIFIGTLYNRYGASGHPLLKNIAYAPGYVTFMAGPLEVALGRPIALTTSGPHGRLLEWLTILTGLIMTTGHVQDLADQEGDATRGRRTLPLVIGDWPARWTIAVGLVFWGLYCPSKWPESVVSGAMVSIVAAFMALRTLLMRSPVADKMTFTLYNSWLGLTSILPFLTF